MSEFLLMVERLMADGADAAMFVSEDTYKGAMFGCVFAEPVHGYVWCDRHGWVLADEACVCGDCVHEAMEADFERLCEIEEHAWLETERAAEWAVQQFVSQYGQDWVDDGVRGEMAYRRINRTDPNYDPEYLRPHVDDPCYECGCSGARLELCHDGIARPLCTPCWSCLYRH